MADKYLDESGLSYFWTKLKAYFQEKLVSGTNIKTINSQSLLGSGDIQVAPSVTSTDVPTADTISEFDSSAHMNSTDMTSQDVSDFLDGLDVGGVNLRDYVIDEKSYTGTDGTAWCRKWNSGILEVWYSLNTRLTSYASYNIGALFKVTLSFYNELGVSFVDTKYTVNHLWNVGSGVAYPSGHQKSATQVEVFANANNTGTQTCDVCVYMCGRWK